MALTWTPGSVVPWQNVGFGSTATFSGLNGGVNYPAGCFVIAAVAIRQGYGNIAPLTITIGGQSVTASAPIISNAGPGTADSLNIYGVTIPSSAPDTVVISGGSNFGWEAVAAGYLTGSATTATATGYNTSNE